MAIGAKLRETRDGYLLDLDEDTLRQRAIATLQRGLEIPQMSMPKSVTDASEKIAIATYRQVTNQQIREAFDNQIGILVKEMGPAVRTAVAAKTKVLMGIYSSIKQAGGSDDITYIILTHIDWSLEPYGVTLQPALGVPVAYHRIGGGTVPD